MATGKAGTGPSTHIELFAGLGDAGVAYLLTGATALSLHGVPRLTTDVDILLEPDPGNVARALALLSTWGYVETRAGEPGAAGVAVRRFSHGSSALDRVDVVLPPPGEFARLVRNALTVDLVGVPVPLVGARDLREVKSRSAREEDAADAAGLDTLAAIAAGRAVEDGDVRAVQIRKFSRWSIPYRCNWLLEAARLAKGMSPEAKAPTRGLVRRRPWTDRRG